MTSSPLGDSRAHGDVGDPIRYATELELCRAHRETWLRMQWAMETNDTQAVSELAERLDRIVSALRDGDEAATTKLESHRPVA
jgi:hypothetical protein